MCESALITLNVDFLFKHRTIHRKTRHVYKISLITASIFTTLFIKTKAQSSPTFFLTRAVTDKYDSWSSVVFLHDSCSKSICCSVKSHLLLPQEP